MANFRAIRNIPDAPNNPSVDQPKMKVNNNSMIDLIDVDHIGYNQTNGGYHDIIHQQPQVSDPSPIINTGQIYPKVFNNNVELFYESGNISTATGTVQQLTNGTGVLPRAFVNFSDDVGLASNININDSFNVSSVTRIFAGVGGAYAINFTTPMKSRYYYPTIIGQYTGANSPLPIVGTLFNPQNGSSIAAITNIVLGASTVVTAINSFTALTNVILSGINGTTELNGNSYQITSRTPTSFTLAVDSTTFTPYINGGTATNSIYVPNNNTLYIQFYPLGQTVQVAPSYASVMIFQ